MKTQKQKKSEIFFRAYYSFDIKKRLADARREHSGSALLVALIVMGILLTLSLGVSEILVGTIKDSRQLLEKTKAWYAAESGIERALLDISMGPPGFEIISERTLAQEASNKSNFKYRIKATAGEIPQREPYEITNEKDKFASLRLNESITIPLFKGTAPEDTVKNFRVNYYLSPDLKLQNELMSDDVDILRWKIFGIANKDGVMEVINEFLPANEGDSAENPTCMGTPNDCYNTAKFYERRATGDGEIEFEVVPKYPIVNFINNHTQNFLVLTNIVNTDLIAGSLSTSEKQALANIKYRVIEEDGEGQKRLTLPIINISSDGYSGSSIQSINLNIKREEFLPVFNYALYRTAE